MKIKHTPGPWRIGKYGEVLTKKNERLLLTGVSLTSGNHPDQEEADANARLLVASPELLKACKEAYKYLKFSHGEKGYKVVELLERAIAKVKECE